MLLSEKDKTVNPEYDNAATLYAIENLATYTRDMCNESVLGMINLKKDEQIARLTKMVGNYRSKRAAVSLDMQIIGGGSRGYYF